jgi:hypothetical protein
VKFLKWFIKINECLTGLQKGLEGRILGFNLVTGLCAGLA